MLTTLLKTQRKNTTTFARSLLSTPQQNFSTYASRLANFLELLESIWAPRTPVSQLWSLATQKLSRTPKVGHFDTPTCCLTSCLGARTTPSVVAFAEDGTRHVGDVAKRQVSNFKFVRAGGLLCPSKSYLLLSIFLDLFLFQWNLINNCRPYKIQNILSMPPNV